MRPRFWTDAMREELLRLEASGLTRAQIGAKLGVTKNAVNGEYFRIKHPGTVKRSNAKQALRAKEGRAPHSPQEPRWEVKLTEPWHVFHARKEAERKAAKAKS